ncbi:MAG: hypothetical protein LVS60_05650 [Nodosilinea sp. LVE1205-7]
MELLKRLLNRCSGLLLRRNQGWELQRVKPTRDPIIRVDCVVEGEQTSFEDDRYEGSLGYLQSG